MGEKQVFPFEGIKALAIAARQGVVRPLPCRRKGGLPEIESQKRISVKPPTRKYLPFPSRFGAFSS
jgi:hypothetical protein